PDTCRAPTVARPGREFATPARRLTERDQLGVSLVNEGYTWSFAPVLTRKTAGKCRYRRQRPPSSSAPRTDTCRRTSGDFPSRRCATGRYHPPHRVRRENGCADLPAAAHRGRTGRISVRSHPGTS